MLAVAEGGGESRALSRGIVAADPFAAVVGLPGQIAERDATAMPVLLDARSRAREFSTALLRAPDTFSCTYSSIISCE